MAHQRSNIRIAISASHNTFLSSQFSYSVDTYQVSRSRCTCICELSNQSPFEIERDLGWIYYTFLHLSFNKIQNSMHATPFISATTLQGSLDWQHHPKIPCVGLRMLQTHHKAPFLEEIAQCTEVPWPRCSVSQVQRPKGKASFVRPAQGLLEITRKRNHVVLWAERDGGGREQVGLWAAQLRKEGNRILWIYPMPPAKAALILAAQN